MPRTPATDLGVVGAAAHIRARELAAAEYHAELMKRFESDMKFSNAMLKDFTTDGLKTALASAEFKRQKDKSAAAHAVLEGRLASVPYVVSSAIDVKGHYTSGGNSALAAANKATDDADVVSKLTNAGAVCFGVANTHELNLGSTARHPVHGLVKNPFSKTAFTGGAQGGIAAMVGGHAVPFGIGIDSLGDVRVAAALCGCVGFRPSVDRYSTRGCLTLSNSVDVLGIITRNAEDTLAIDAVLTSSEAPAEIPAHASATAAASHGTGGLAGKRIGIPKSMWEGVSAAAASVLQNTLDRIKAAGGNVVEIEFDSHPLDTAAGIIKTLVAYESVREIGVYLSRHKCSPPLPPKPVDEEEESEEAKPVAKPPAIVDTFLSTSAIAAAVACPPVEKEFLLTELSSATATSSAEYRNVLVHTQPALQKQISTQLTDKKLDFIAYPTAPSTALTLRGADHSFVEVNGASVSANQHFTRNARLASALGWPAVALGVGLTVPTADAGVDSTDGERLPVGLEFMGPAGSDTSLLRFAAAVQSIHSPLPDPIVISRWNVAVTI